MVILSGVVFVWGTYFLLVGLKKNRKFQLFAHSTHLERKGWWLSLQHRLDGEKN
jgi:hypothetical protein